MSVTRFDRLFVLLFLGGAGVMIGYSVFEVAQGQYVFAATDLFTAFGWLVILLMREMWLRAGRQRGWRDGRRQLLASLPIAIASGVRAVDWITQEIERTEGMSLAEILVPDTVAEALQQQDGEPS